MRDNLRKKTSAASVSVITSKATSAFPAKSYKSTLYTTYTYYYYYLTFTLNVLSACTYNALCVSSTPHLNLIDYTPLLPFQASQAAAMASTTFSRLSLAIICLTMLTVSRVLAQTVAPSNQSTDNSVEFVLNTIINQMSIAPKILPLTNGAGLSGTLSQLDVRLSSHSLSRLL